MKQQIEDELQRVCNEKGLTFEFTNESSDGSRIGEASELQGIKTTTYHYRIFGDGKNFEVGIKDVSEVRDKIDWVLKQLG